MIKMRSESRQDLLSVHNYASFFLDRLRTKGYVGMTDGWLGTNNIVHFDFVFFPTCTGDHWFLVTINNREKSITISHSKLVEGRANAAFNYICTFLASLSRTKGGLQYTEYQSCMLPPTFFQANIQRQRLAIQ